MTFDSFSKYKNMQPIKVDGKRTIGLWPEPEVFSKLDENTDITYYKVTSVAAGRPDLISNTFYGSPYYYWILIAYNKPLDVIGWPTTGTIIKIPKRYAITSIL